MSADALLERLDRVRKAGPDRWMACCPVPAHDDGRASLSIRELDDGRVLVHCFAGCAVDDVVAAVGLDLSDLFPPRPIEHGRRERRPFNAHDVLEAVVGEVRLAAVFSSFMRNSGELSDLAHERLLVCFERLEEARRLANGER